MAVRVPDAIQDAMLTAAEGTHIHVCTGEPADFAGIAALELAAGPLGGAYTKGDGTPDGRRNTVPATPGLTATGDGTATHVAISNNTDTLYKVTTAPAQAITTGNTVDINAWGHEIGDATQV